MIRIIHIFTFLCLSLISWASNFEEGNAHYMNEDYDAAIKSYTAELNSGIVSSNLYFNLGNAYHKNNELGKAVWAYESALKIDPKNSDAQKNLTFVNKMTIDQIDNDKPGIGQWFKNTLFGPYVNLWAWLSIGMAVLLAASLLLFFKSTTRKWRNLGLFGGMGSSILLILACCLAYFHKDFVMAKTEAIVIETLVEVKVAPKDETDTSFELHEGTKVQLLEMESGWQQIEVNGNNGWVKANQIWGI